MVLAIILVLLIWALWFFGPMIRRWLMRRSINYVQDRMYRSMGIDPQELRKAQQQANQSTYNSRRTHRHAHTHTTGKIIPRDYGEVISFEVTAITGSEKWLIDTDKSPVFTKYGHETQITDVKYVIIS